MSESGHVPHQDPTPRGEEGSGSETGETWDEVKTDYQIDPDGEPVPNSMDATTFEPVEDDETGDDGEEGE